MDERKNFLSFTHGSTRTTAPRISIQGQEALLVSLSISVLHEEYLQILSEIVQDWWKENELPVLSHCEIELSSCGGAFCICSIC